MNTNISEEETKQMKLQTEIQEYKKVVKEIQELIDKS